MFHQSTFSGWTFWNEFGEKQNIWASAWKEESGLSFAQTSGVRWFHSISLGNKEHLSKTARNTNQTYKKAKKRGKVRKFHRLPIGAFGQNKQGIFVNEYFGGIRRGEGKIMRLTISM